MDYNTPRQQHSGTRTCLDNITPRQHTSGHPHFWGKTYLDNFKNNNNDWTATDVDINWQVNQQIYHHESRQQLTQQQRIKQQQISATTEESKHINNVPSKLNGKQQTWLAANLLKVKHSPPESNTDLPFQAARKSFAAHIHTPFAHTAAVTIGKKERQQITHATEEKRKQKIGGLAKL